MQKGNILLFFTLKFRVEKLKYKLDKSQLHNFTDYSIIQLESILSMIDNIPENNVLNIKLIEDRLQLLGDIEVEQAVPHIIACIELELCKNLKEQTLVENQIASSINLLIKKLLTFLRKTAGKTVNSLVVIMIILSAYLEEKVA